MTGTQLLAQYVGLLAVLVVAIVFALGAVQAVMLIADWWTRRKWRGRESKR